MTEALKCPHCEDSILIDHQTFAPKSVDALHCFECGCCFQADGKTPRAGVPVCNSAREEVIEEATEEKPVSRMNRAELIEMAEKLGVSFSEDVTVAQLRDLLKAPEVE